MGLFRRRKGEDVRDKTSETQDVTNPPNEELTEQAQEVMKDNLELMKDVVMRIREDPEFASNIYADCPRLQHLLDQYPDLRPIFEDPKLVRINFEQVYRDAGGVLPEDEKKKRSWLVWFVNSPIFKLLKVLLFVKKLVACIVGGGFAFLSGCLMGCCFEDALEELDGEAEDGDANGEGEMDPAKEALNKAADHMEDPEVQEQMQALLEDPDNLQEAIENDSELKALRDSNPLCEELMSDPETMRVLTDPDNLRALGEAPQLIEADFIDPEGFMPSDIETGGFDGLGDGYDAFDGGNDGMDFAEADVDFDVDADAELDVDDGFDGGDDVEADDDLEGEGEEEEEEDEGWWEDAELEQQEIEADGGDGADGGGNNQNVNANRAKSQAKQSQAAAQEAAEGQGRSGGIMATIGVAATDLIAAQIVGNVFGDFIPGGGGMGGISGGDGLDSGGFTDMADDAGDVIDDDVADVAEDTMDEADEKAVNKASAEGEDAELDKDGDGKKTGAGAGGATAGGAIAGGAAVSGARGKGDGNRKESVEEESEFEDEEPVEEPKKKGRFAFVGNFVSAISTAAKEHVTTAILGDDWGEALVERIEEGGDKEDGDKDKKEGDEEDGDKDKREGDEDDEKKKKRGFFGRGKNKAE